MAAVAWAIPQARSPDPASISPRWNSGCVAKRGRLMGSSASCTASCRGRSPKPMTRGRPGRVGAYRDPARRRPGVSHGGAGLPRQCPMMALAAYTAVWAAAGLVLAAIYVHSPAEVGESSAGFALGFGLVPDPAQGQYQGALGLGFGAGQALAPADPHHGGARTRHGRPAAAGAVLRGTGRCRPVSCPLGHADPAAARRCRGRDGLTGE